MERNSTRLWAELTKFYASMWIDLPLAAMRRMSSGNDDELRAAGWRAYDSWIGLMNEAVNELYSNRVLGDVWGRGLEAAFTMRHISDQLTLATLNGGSKTPTASETLTGPAITEGSDASPSPITNWARNPMAKAA